MFETLPTPKPDAIFDTLRRFQSDPRSNKVNLGIGVYQDEGGATPIFAAVKRAEERLLAEQATKSYLGLAGDEIFAQHLTGLVVDERQLGERLVSVQAPGGSGALRLLFELVEKTSPEATVWMPDPTWPNHPGIVHQVGLTARSYSYFDASLKSVDFEKLLQSLGSLRQKDILLVHACCHNPTGADLSEPQWNAIADLCLEKGAIPLIDLAYQGLGHGMEQDRLGSRILMTRLPESMLAISCSKNFGLYRERTGCAAVVSTDGDVSSKVRGTLMSLGRVNYSMPPDHGAAIVRIILDDRTLRTIWLEELNGMRTRMRSLRDRLADLLADKSQSTRFEYLRDHNGMFSLIGATSEQVAQLCERHAIYMIGNGRINVAGLREQSVEALANAFLDVGL